MSALAKPSSLGLTAHVGRAQSLDLIERVRTTIAAVRTQLREWHSRVESRRELRLNTDLIAYDTAYSTYDVAQELKKPFWRA